jgi:hypothetical protein
MMDCTPYTICGFEGDVAERLDDYMAVTSGAMSLTTSSDSYPFPWLGSSMQLPATLRIE